MKSRHAGALLATTLMVACARSPGQLTQPQFVAEATAICRAAGQPYAGGRPSQPLLFRDFLQAQLPAQQKGLKALEALRPPDEQQGNWLRQVIKPEREQLAETKAALGQLENALRRNDQGAAFNLVQQTTSRLDERGAGINRYWKLTGMTACLDSPL